MDAVILLVAGVGSLMLGLYMLLHGRDRINIDNVLAATLLAVFSAVLGALAAIHGYVTVGQQCTTVTGTTEVQTCINITTQSAFIVGGGLVIIEGSTILLILVVIIILLNSVTQGRFRW